MDLPPPSSLKRKLRLESLDDRAVPSTSPGDPPDTPPPQAGDPAAQASLQMWGYEVAGDGTVELGLYEADTAGLPDTAVDFTSVYDPRTGAITAATTVATAARTPISLPANPLPGHVYAYNPASGTWGGAAISSDGAFLSPAAGNTVTPIRDAAGAVEYWAVHPQTTGVLATQVAAFVPEQGQPPRTPKPVKIEIPEGSQIVLPDGTVINLPNGGTATVNPDGQVVIEGPGATTTSPGGATTPIGPGGTKVPIGWPTGTIYLPDGTTMNLPSRRPAPTLPVPPRPLPPTPTWPSHPLDPLFPPPNTVRPIYRTSPFGILTDPLNAY